MRDIFDTTPEPDDEIYLAVHDHIHDGIREVEGVPEPTKVPLADVTCGECGLYASLNKSGLCSHCRVGLKTKPVRRGPWWRRLKDLVFKYRPASGAVR